jgi:DHHC palmitoyltransferase
MSTITQRNATGADLPQHQQQQPTQSTMGTPQRRRIFHICGISHFSVPRRITDAIMTTLTTLADGFVYLLGPFLIAFASVIISGLAYTYFCVLLPMMERAYAKDPWGTLYTRMHTTFVCFILTNVIFNYVACVATSNKGKKFDRVVRELADATGFTYPETPEEVVQAKRDIEDRMIFRMQRRQARAHEMAAGGTAPAPQRGWMIMGPHEWGFCSYTGQPKPPRSHYDHVTKMLVLNMDHFCPWMFNTGECCVISSFSVLEL